MGFWVLMMSRLSPSAWKDPQVLWVPLDRLGLRVRRVPLVRVRRDQVERRVRLEQPVRRDQRARPVFRVNKAQPAQQAQQGPRVRRELRVPKAIPGRLAQWDRKAYLALPGCNIWSEG